jgi:hypothetical protein
MDWIHTNITLIGLDGVFVFGLMFIMLGNLLTDHENPDFNFKGLKITFLTIGVLMMLLSIGKLIIYFW